MPGNELCLDRDTLRTYERRVLTQRVTDISKCRYEDKGDDQGKLEDQHARVDRRFRSDCRRHSEALYPLCTLAATTVPYAWRFLFWPLLDLRALERR